MDRTIDPGVRWRRGIRRSAAPAGVTAAAIVFVILVAAWLHPSVRRDQLRTARVERGDVTATLDASGLVVPGAEQILTSPVSARVVRILKTAGAEARPGEPIVLLDDKYARRDAARLEEQIALERNASRRTGLELERTRGDLVTSRDVKALELESCRFELNRNRKMFAEGFTNEDAVRNPETDVARARIELGHLESQLPHAEKDLAARVEGQALEIAILDKDLERVRERFAGTAVAAERAGIVTWVVGTEGATAAEGEPVARVADVSTYRVDATLSDVLARRLTAGVPAVVRTGDARLTGPVRKILPAVQNGVVAFQVDLDEPGHAILRPNLRVDVNVVTERRTGALRLRRGPLVTVDGQDAVFVVRGNRAVRTTVTLGLSNFEM